MLSHYSKYPIEVFSNVLHRDDNEHKPGGLWLSDESGYGWSALVSEQLRLGSSGWEDDDELPPDTGTTSGSTRSNWTGFSRSELPTTCKDSRRTIERHHRGECVDEGKPGYGLHIDWSRVKSDYKGILITPYQPGLSHRNGNPDFHWYRFDCASGCFWDIICLRLLGRSLKRGLPGTSAP